MLIRNYKEEDIAAIAALVNMADQDDGLNKPATEDDFRQHFNTTGLDPQRQVIVVEGVEDQELTGLPKGMLLGFGRAFPSPNRPVSDEQQVSGAISRTYNVMLRAHPSSRPYGLEGIIARHLVEIVRSHEEAEADPQRRVRLRTYLSEWHTSARKA